MSVQFSYVFDRKNKARKSNQLGLIELRAYQNPKAKYFTTKIEIRSTEWNGIRQEVKSINPDAERHNIFLKKFKNDIENKKGDAFHKNRPFTLDDVKAHFKNRKVTTSSFIDFVTTELENDRSIKQKTKIQHYNTLKKLRNFNKDADILFSDISFSLVSEFLNYLRSQNLAVNTIHKQHKNIKKYIDLAIKKGLIDIPNPCNEIKAKSENKPREVLTPAQLTTIEQLQIEENKIRQARDMFLFACYTGLRISDVTALRSEYITTSEKGLELNFYTVKVNKKAHLPLHILFPVPNNKSKPEQILLKYLLPDSDLVFPKLSEQYINRHLKLVAELAGIGFNLTFHIGRETFGTYMAGKLPVPMLMRLLQHSDIKTTMRYVHINEQMINDHLIKVDWS